MWSVFVLDKQSLQCAWCLQPDYTAPQRNFSKLSRCDFFEHHNSCQDEFLFNPRNKEVLRANVSNEDAISSSIQYIKLRMNDTYELQLNPRNWTDPPLDIYFLIDATKSMEKYKQSISEQIGILNSTLGNLTTNCHFGFGEFGEKPLSPYISTIPSKLNKPCAGCEASFGFKNHLSLSRNISVLRDLITDSPLIGNIDHPEATLDGIMQALVCTEEIGWRKNSIKLLIIITDAGFHIAGDGKLGGIVGPNDGKCHLNSQGEYTSSTKQDYPSIGHVNYEAYNRSIQLLFQVSSDQIDFYNSLKDVFNGSKVVLLEEAPSKAAAFVFEQIHDIISSTEFSENLTDLFSISYSSASNLTVDIIAPSCPKDLWARNHVIQITSKGIQESWLIVVELVCECDCENPGHSSYVESAEHCHFNGDLICGDCQCNLVMGHGEHCETVCRDYEREDLLDQCRSSENSPVCSNRGVCECGSCFCRPRENRNERVYGQYCECDNFSCDRYNGLLCSGNGVCECGRCKCRREWRVPGYDACECKASLSTFMNPFRKYEGEICSGNGNCVCGECKCEEGYSGRYCESCLTCPSQCELLKPCVNCYNTNEAAFNQDVEVFGGDCRKCSMNKVSHIEKMDDFVIGPGETHCNFYDDNSCIVAFGYKNIDGGDDLKIWIERENICPSGGWISAPED
ncbi:ITGB1 [Lepeophtheirus salmonis]|uniref:Integrin beta n=1 Tax=Lepeophtheirus salmonis TaxID=72036 RepID=A0A7R8H4X1_LEPSM|nr:ITGB1 [Lepeophtheirus salmonis]CAF2852648.1 ITGB1 [Lepeophtheirus salmonis]